MGERTALLGKGPERPKSPGALVFERILEEDAGRNFRMSLGDTHGYRVALAIEGTIVPVLVREPLFVLCVLGFVILRTLALLGKLQTDAEVQFRGTSMLGGAVTFFLVFYASQTFTRFQAQYFHARDAGSAILAFAQQARSFLPRHRALRLVRQLNAAQMMAYVGLHEDCAHDFIAGFNEEHHILSPAEYITVQRLDVKTMAGTSALIQWVMDGLGEALREEEISEARLAGIVGSVLEVKSSLSRLFHFSHQPIPFAYVHLATLLSYVYLPLLTVTLAMAPTKHAEIALWEFQNAAALFFTCAFVLGLRETARIMSDPFGNDDYDLPVLSFGIATIKKCNATMTLREADPLDLIIDDAPSGSGFAPFDPSMV